MRRQSNANLFLEHREQATLRFYIRLQFAGKLQGRPTDNGFKQVQIAYLAVISNLDKLSYMLSKQIRLLASPWAC